MDEADIEKIRRAFEGALERLQGEPEPLLTSEELEMMISQVVDRAINKRATDRWNQIWKVVQRVGWVVGPLVGLTVIWSLLTRS